MRGIINLMLMLLNEVRRFFGVKRAMKTDDSDDACVACGSTDVVIAADRRLCLSCGYEGRADGGGDLTREELSSLYDDEGGLMR